MSWCTSLMSWTLLAKKPNCCQQLQGGEPFLMFNTCETPSGVLCPYVVSPTQETQYCHIGTSPVESQQDNWRFMAWKERMREQSLFNMKKTRQPMREWREDRARLSAPRCTGTGRQAADKIWSKEILIRYKRKIFSHKDGRTLEQVAQSCCGISITELKTHLYMCLSYLM